MTDEKRLEMKLREAAKKMGGKALKFVSPGHAGVADRIVLMPGGKVWFVELKGKGGRLSPLQLIFQKQMAQMGLKYLVIDTDEKLAAFVEMIKKPEQREINGL